MIDIDPAWAGKVQFYELVFGTWSAYIFLVLLWERILKAPLPEWRYVLLNFMGGGAFWVNHYFQKAPFWSLMLNLYTVLFLAVWCWQGIGGHARSWGWKIAAFGGAIAYTVVFIAFEQLARYGVEQQGMHEFWFMAMSYAGFVALIVWRGRATAPRLN